MLIILHLCVLSWLSNIAGKLFKARTCSHCICRRAACAHESSSHCPAINLEPCCRRKGILSTALRNYLSLTELAMIMGVRISGCEPPSRGLVSTPHAPTSAQSSSVSPVVLPEKVILPLSLHAPQVNYRGCNAYGSSHSDSFQHVHRLPGLTLQLFSGKAFVCTAVRPARLRGGEVPSREYGPRNDFNLPLTRTLRMLVRHKQGRILCAGICGSTFHRSKQLLSLSAAEEGQQGQRTSQVRWQMHPHAVSQVLRQSDLQTL